MNGLEAVTAAQGTPYDLILMDLSMPVLDGLEATRRIRALGGRNEYIPILALTAHAGRSEHGDCKQAGFTDVLTKPSPRSTLRAALVRWQAVRPESSEQDLPRDPARTCAPSETGPDASDPAFAEARSLHDTIEEFRLSLGDDAVPGMLRAGLNDLARHSAVISEFQGGKTGADEVLKRSFHSLVSITRLFGCPDLGERAQFLEKTSATLKHDNPQVTVLLGLVSALQGQLKSILQTLDKTNPTSMPGVES